MKRILSLVAGLSLLIAGCGGGDETATSDPLADYANAVDSLSAGHGITNAPAYRGGTVPHKVGLVPLRSTTPATGEVSDYWLSNWFELPAEWQASSIAEMQLYVKVDTTKTHTGQSQLYVRFEWNTTGTTYEWVHLTRTYRLLAAQTGEVIATTVLQGVWTGFPATVPEGGNATIEDVVPDFSVREWVRPFVER